jgi:peptidoglycan hydrolase-like protein with peptidoglycan-binding domain
MRKIILLLTILLSANFAFAQDIGTDIGLSVETDKLINYIESSVHPDPNATVSDKLNVKIRRYKDAINWLSEKKNALEKQVTRTANPSCQKISQTLLEGRHDQDVLGGDVKRLQQYLSFSGYGYNLKDDGVYGPVTTTAIKKFQLANGIKQTGAVGPITLAKINSMICKSSDLNQKSQLKEVSVTDTQDNNRKISFFLQPGELNFDGLTIIKKGDSDDFLLNGAILGIRLIRDFDQKTITNIDLYTSKSQTALDSCGPKTFVQSLNSYVTNGVTFKKYLTSVNDGSGNTYTYSTVNGGTCYNVVVNIGGDCAKFTCSGPEDKYERTIESVENNVLKSVTFFRNTGY